MLPSQLVAGSFATYRTEARRQAETQLAILRKLPLGLAPLLLRELIVYDFKFPAERRELDRQFAYLGSLSSEQLTKTVAAFSQLRLPATLEKTDWVNSPAGFTEQLTAHLWTTHQIDAFSAAAVEYVDKSRAAFPEDPLPAHRLGVAVIGQGVRNNQYRLFRKLRPLGTSFQRVKQTGGVNALIEAVAKRAADYPVPYGHWYIDGGAAPPVFPAGVTGVSSASLSPARAALQKRMQTFYEAPVFDPEMFRTRLAQIQPEEIGLRAASASDVTSNPQFSQDALLMHFDLSLLTEGSGTQVFATTFVQWAAREALRRAQPVTLLARFGQRQRENPMNELLSEAAHPFELDPQGSLIDADMGTYYNWLNLQRLPFAEDAAFLAWFEDHQEAFAIGPGFGRGKSSDAPIELRDLIARLA
jgi:hypothetical protein